MLDQLKALITSRRVVVLLGAGVLFAAKWKFVGKPDPAEWSTFLALVAAWLQSNAKRRHAGSLASSRRFLVGALSQVVPVLLGMLGVAVPGEALAALNGLVASFILGEGERRHVEPEDAPPPKPDES